MRQAQGRQANREEGSGQAERRRRRRRKGERERELPKPACLRVCDADEGKVSHDGLSLLCRLRHRHALKLAVQHEVLAGCHLIVKDVVLGAHTGERLEMMVLVLVEGEQLRANTVEGKHLKANS